MLVDVPNDDAEHMLRMAAASVYSLAPGAPIGQPRSVLEAAVHGTPLVVPDEPAMHHLVGETAHFFRRGDSASLAAAIGGAMERPHSTDERHALAERVRRRHAATAVHEAWADSVTRAVVNWQRNARTDRTGVNLRWWWPN